MKEQFILAIRFEEIPHGLDRNPETINKGGNYLKTNNLNTKTNIVQFVQVLFNTGLTVTVYLCMFNV